MNLPSVPSDPTAEEPCAVVCGDSRPILAAMPDGFADHIISDPPFSDKTHAGARTNAHAGRLVTFDSISEEDFLTFCRQAVRVAKRWVVMTCDWRHAALAEREMPGEFVRAGVWVKDAPMPQLSGDRPATGWEAVAVLHRRGRKRWNGGGLPAVWRCHVQRDGLHPTQKPLALLRKWVKQFTDEGETIIDPYAGSGGTGLACLYEGRRAVLIEKEEEHCRTCRERRDRFLREETYLPPYKHKAAPAKEEFLI